MASIPHAQVAGLAQLMGAADGGLTFEEAIQRMSAHKLLGPITKPIGTFRDAGETGIGDWPLRDACQHGGKVEQFVDVIPNYKGKIDRKFFDDVLLKNCAQGNYKDLPAPFRLKTEPTVPYTMQLVITPVKPPEVEADTDNLDEKQCHHIAKHVYLHKNKIFQSSCMDWCEGVYYVLDYGLQHRVGALAFNHMMDETKGKQIRYWITPPKHEKKPVPSEDDRAKGYKFIREFGPRSDNPNQFRECADTQVNAPGSDIHGWSEARVITALQRYQKGLLSR